MLGGTYIHRAYMEVARGIHGIPPLWRDYANRIEMCFNIARSNGRSESRPIDQQRSVLDRSVRRQAMSRDLMSEHPQIAQRREFRGHPRDVGYLCLDDKRRGYVIQIVFIS